MAAVMLPYVIKDGDYLTKVAHERGFDADAVWGDPKNQEINKLRNGKMDMLCSGDCIYIPSKPTKGLQLTVGTTNRYSANVPVTMFHMQFNGLDGSPLANEAYTYTIEGTDAQGTTDGTGQASFSLPVTATEVHIVFPSTGFATTAKVGHLDPAEESSGVRQRLVNLRYCHPASGDEDGDAKTLAKAIGAFQSDQNLPVTSQMDAATIAKLKEAHKS